MTERFISPGTPCTPRQREILICMMEEAAEVQQRAAKALRFGLDEVQPGQPLTNAERLAQEVGDMGTLVAVACEEGVICDADVFQAQIAKRAKLQVYMQTTPADA